MKWLSFWRSVALIGLGFAVGIVGKAAPGSSMASAQYCLGETVLFRVVDHNICWWCCGSCEPTCATEILRWHISDICGVWVYAVEHDVPVLASAWQGSWAQVNSSGAQVSSGYYQLTVETSAGTFSRCLRIYEACCRGCWNPCHCRNQCTCNEVTSITHCCCRTSLVMGEEPSCCSPSRDFCSSSCP